MNWDATIRDIPNSPGLAPNQKSCKHSERQGCSDKDVDKLKNWYEISKCKSVKTQEWKANGWQNKTGSNWVGSRTARKYESSLVALKLTVSLEPGAFDHGICLPCERSTVRRTNKAICTRGWGREWAGMGREAALRTIVRNRKYVANLESEEQLM